MKTKPNSLTRRLLFGALLWVLCSLVAVAVLLNTLFKQHLEEQLHKELQIHMTQLIAQLHVHDDQLQIAPLSDPRFQQPLSGLYWQIEQIDQGHVSYTWFSRSLWDERMQPPAAQENQESWFRFDDPGLGELYMVGRYVRLPDTGHSYQLWMAAQAGMIAQPLQRFMTMLILALVALGGVLVLGVWWQLRLGLKPLHQLRMRLGAVHEGTAQTIDGDYPQEIQPLVSDFNRVLQSHAQLVARARTEASNWSHAIKTPLAVLHNAAKENGSNLAKLVLDQVATAQQQIDYHLSRSRVVAATKPVGVRTQLKPAIESLVKLMQKAYASKHIEVDLVLSDALFFRGEAYDLHEMLGNVIDNAFKWSIHHVRISTQAATDGASNSALIIRIEDDGPGLRATQQSKIFTRGVRLDEQLSGSGLGLAISADVVQFYGGHIAASPSELGGLCVSLHLP